MKYIKKTTALCAAVVGLTFALVGCGEAGLSVGGTYRYDDAEHYLSGNGSLDAATINKLSVEWIAGEVVLRLGSSDQITFTETTAETDPDYLMYYSLEGSELNIRFQKSGTKTKSNFEKTLVIEYPAGHAFRDVEVDTASAEVSVYGLNSTGFEADTASGGVKIVCESVTEAQVNTASGDVFVYGLFGKLECETASGDVYLTFPDGNGFRVSFESASGRVNNSTAAVYSGKTYVYGNGQMFAEVDTASGNLFLATGYDE